jgi:hypothetical protein
MMRTLQQLELNNCGLVFLFLSERSKPMARDTVKKINH